MTSTSGSGPTWYDLLGLAPDATPDQIKAAWRDATDKFEPGTGGSQFRLFNEAADVLLDPAKRAEYDAEVGVPVADPVADPEPVAEPEPEPVAEPETEAEADAERSGGIPLAVWVVTVLATLAVLSVVVAGFMALRLHGDVSDREDKADAGAEAMSVAERALTASFSFDYRHMDADLAKAERYMTPRYKKEYRKPFALLTEGPNGGPGPAEKTKVVLTASALASGVVDAEKDKVRVLTFLNQSSVKGDDAPLVFQNRVVVTMVHRGGSWLIDEVASY